MVKINKSNEERKAEIYFIIPRREAPMLSDMAGLRMTNEINKAKGIDHLFLNSEENYPLVEDYCNQRNIDLTKIIDTFELEERVMKNYRQNKQKMFVYVSQLPDEEEINRAAQRLSQRGFYVESRIASSS